MNLFDEHIRSLTAALEAQNPYSASYEDGLKSLIRALRERLKLPKIQERYRSYDTTKTSGNGYPIAKDTFAQSLDALDDEEAFWKIWSEEGIVVGKSIVSKKLCDEAVARMRDIVLDLSDGECDLLKRETWEKTPVDAQGISFISRGFFEVYHDFILAELRQSLRMYLHHVLIWGRADLWTSFDRLGVKLPGHAESAALPLHVDQNPKIHPHFKTVQGVLGLSDCPAERGTFVGAPGSKARFPEFSRFAPDRGEYVEIPTSDPVWNELKKMAQPIPLRAGDIVSWDSRTTHANTDNISYETRYVAYIAEGPAREDDPAHARTRMEAFRSGMGSNVREALMHASKKARYSNYEKLAHARKPEHLTVLGELLYGKRFYAEI